MSLLPLLLRLRPSSVARHLSTSPGSVLSGCIADLSTRWLLCPEPDVEGGVLPPGAEEGEGDTDWDLPFVGEGGADCRKQKHAASETVYLTR